MTAPVERAMIWSEDAEQAVLGAMMLDPMAISEVMPILDAEMFFDGKHRRIFTALVTLFQGGVPIDPLSLAEELERKAALSAAGGKDYIGVLLYVVPTWQNVKHHAGIVRERSARRRLKELSQQMFLATEDLTVPVADSIAAMSKGLAPISGLKTVDGFHQVKDLLWSWMERMEGLNGTKALGRQTGYPELDQQLYGGPMDGDFVILAGVPSSGKTAVALNFAVNMALEQGEGVAIVSAETSREKIIARLVSIAGGIEGNKLRTGKLSGTDHSRVAQTVALLGRLPLWIDDTPTPDLDDVVAKVRLLKAQHPNLKTVIVDFLQLVQVKHERGELGAQVLTRISYGLKGLAMELGICLIATCQPNDKQIDDRDDKRPTLRDLQGSSGMRQAADFVMLVYRPGQYSPGHGNDVIEISVAKAKDMDTFKRELIWEPSFTRVNSRARQAVERIRKEDAEEAMRLQIGGRR